MNLLQTKLALNIQNLSWYMYIRWVYLFFYTDKQLFRKLENKISMKYLLFCKDKRNQQTNKTYIWNRVVSVKSISGKQIYTRTVLMYIDCDISTIWHCIEDFYLCGACLLHVSTQNHKLWTRSDFYWQTLIMLITNKFTGIFNWWRPQWASYKLQLIHWIKRS